MAARDRLTDTPFTCSNRRFHTNINKGKPHGSGEALGSVFEEPLVPGDYSLWLEYAVDTKTDSETFWLMWYDADGSPTIPLSGVISAGQVRDMASRLATFIKFEDKSA